MTKKRATKVGWPLKLGFLLLALVPFTCCLLCFFPRLVHEPPETIGLRRDAQGNAAEQIVFEQSYWHFADLPGHTRPFHIRRYSHKCFLEEPGKPRRELTFLRDENISGYSNTCKPVDTSPLWVRAGVFEPDNLSVLVFDEAQIVHRRRLNYTSPGSGPVFNFENGNRTVVYPTAQGFEAYDVITDTVAPWKPPKN